MCQRLIWTKTKIKQHVFLCREKQQVEISLSWQMADISFRRNDRAAREGGFVAGCVSVAETSGDLG